MLPEARITDTSRAWLYSIDIGASRGTPGGDPRGLVALCVSTVINNPMQFQRVLLNLLRNALRHTKPGGRINMASHRDAWEITAKVADTGERIANEDRPQIFDRFYRAVMSRARHTGGSGLGLSISRAIVEDGASHLCAESTPAKGPRFVFTLPLDRSTRVHSARGGSRTT